MEAAALRAPSSDRRILTAELLSIGSELTTGETRDTNSGELARSLTGCGVRVLRLGVLPDNLVVVSASFADSLDRADLVVATGGLGPTPDDLTREAIASFCGETPSVDRELETWLRGLWARRGLAFPGLNLKQAWLIPSARTIPNPNGTAPGWWVERPDGRIIVALPGPPREMRAMWADHVLQLLHEHGLGRVQVTRTYRLAGIGESQVADLLGDGLLHGTNPVVATYARADAVDVRISAVAEVDDGGRAGRSADELVDEAEAVVLGALGPYVWGRDDETWPGAIGRLLESLGWTLATSEIETGGTLASLLGGAPWLRLSEIRIGALYEPPEAAAATLERLAGDVRERGRSDVGLALRVAPGGEDTRVAVAVVTPAGTHHERRLAFLGGAQGRSRAALLAAAILLERLRVAAPETDLAERLTPIQATHRPEGTREERR